MSITTIQHHGMYQPPVGSPVWHTVRDAASASGRSESSIRRAIRRLPTRLRIASPSVSGMIQITVGSQTGYLPYCDSPEFK